MKKVIIIFCVFVSIFVFSQSSYKLEDLYKQGKNLYSQGKYSEALAVFTQIKGLDPSFKKSEIDNYIELTKGKLKELGIKETYELEEGREKEIAVSKEAVQKLIEYAQRILMETSDYLKETKIKHNISDFDMVTPNSIFEMAKKSFDNAQYTEAIRLANRARFEVENIIQKQAEREVKPLLGDLGEKPVTLNLTNADLQQTLKLIYDLTGANIILSKGITGRVTLNVTDIPLKKVLDLICEANGLKYVYEDNVIKIMTKEEYEKKVGTIKQAGKGVFNVKYGEANNIAKILRETFRDVDIIPEPRTNSIIVNTDKSVVLSRIMDTISSLDTPVSQVLIEAKLVEVKTSVDNMFAIDWLITNRFIDALNANLYGPRWGDSFSPSSLPTGTFSFGISHRDVSALIRALSQYGKVRLIQSPKIMTLNGENAVIRVVTDYPYYTVTVTYQTVQVAPGQYVERPTFSTTVTRESVGIEFNITPTINPNRTINLDTRIRDRRLVEMMPITYTSGTTIYQLGQYPVISTREATQKITLFDGQAFVVGGLIQDEERFRESGVPFLRKIPILGYLFKKPTYSESKNELILFITPYIVTSFEEGKELTKPEIKKLEEPIGDKVIKSF